MKVLFALAVIFTVVSLQHNQAFAQSKPDTSDKHSFVEPEETAPKFPGGKDSLEKFISSNIHHVNGAQRKKVFVTFVVETDGSLSHIAIQRGINDEADKEALRLLKISPKWIPGTQANHVQRFQYVLPIRFPAN